MSASVTNVTPEEVDALLPQTQCGLCGFGGCMPYAEALVYDQAPIHLCPPGGVTTLCALGTLLQKNPEPFIAEMERSAKPIALAVIREDECIGCTKCIQACPVDAILGSAKLMHTVITAECTGCELCVAPCPVDCIDLLALSGRHIEPDHARIRYQQREARLKKEMAEKAAAAFHISLEKRKSYIKNATERVKAKKRSILIQS